MKSKTKKLIAIVPITIAALATLTTVVYLFATADPERPNPRSSATASSASSASAVSPESAEPDNPSAKAPSGTSTEAAAKPRNAAERLVSSLSSDQRTRLLLLINEGTSRELVKIHGVGKTRAEAIQAARPFESLADLALVNGVGEITFAGVIEHGKQPDLEEAMMAVAPPSRR